MVVKSNWMNPKEKINKEKRKSEGESERPTGYMLLLSIYPSIPLSVGFTGELCGLVGQSPKFPGSVFGPSLMIYMFRQGHPQLRGPRAKKTNANTETRPATRHLATYRWL